MPTSEDSYNRTVNKVSSLRYYRGKLGNFRVDSHTPIKYFKNLLITVIRKDSIKNGLKIFLYNIICEYRPS